MLNINLLKVLFVHVTISQIIITSHLQAEPYIPQSDAEILIKLPASYNTIVLKLRQHQMQLISAPNDTERAVALAQSYIELGGSTGDPRYNGYAQAALQPWWHLEQAPSEILILRAILRQRQHDFNNALNDLNQVLRVQPKNGQAWLTQAVIHQVQGNYPASKKSCLALMRNKSYLITMSCIANVASLNGRAEESYRALQKVLEQAIAAPAQEKLWAITILAETAARLGKYNEAEQHFLQALHIDGQDTYLLGAYSDLLLDQGRPKDVQFLLQKTVQSDGLLLRIALAEQQLNAPTLKQHVEILKARFAENKLRGESQHLREEARFTLHLLHNSKQALTLAQENWRIQREPWDARLLLEAALSGANQAAAKPVIDWLIAVNLEDHQLNKLREQLP